MASPEEIENFVRRSTEYVRMHTAEIQQLLNVQRAREAEIIQQTGSFCPLAQIQDRTVRAEDIQRALREGYGDSNVLKALMCLNNSTVIFPENAEVGRSFKVRQYLENLKQIGGESADGYAMLADIKSNSAGDIGKNLFVVKAPRRIDAQLRTNQIHEYFVGAFGTNTLRSRIPNFSYVMGFFQCSPPYIDSQVYITEQTATRQNLKDRRALTFCQNDVADNQVNYIIYENITDSVTLREFVIKGCTFEEYINVLSQITLAEDLGFREFRFTHYDLHDENILVRRLSQKIYIPYEVDESGNIKYLYTDIVATIIDFGRSHIQYQNQDFGYALIEYGLYPNRPYPMYDIYKILMFSLASAAFGENDIQSFAGFSDDQLAQQGRLTNPNVFNGAKELISYFFPNIVRNQITRQLITSADYLVKTRKFYYSLPYSPKLDVRPVRFFQSAIMKSFGGTVNRFMVNTPNDKNLIYGCANKGVCLSLEQAISEYSKLDIDYINDVYTFYETFIENRPFAQGGLENLLSQGITRYPDYIAQLRQDRNRYTNEYNQLTQGYTIVSLSQGAPIDIRFTNTFMDLYRRFIAKSVRIVDVLTSIAQIETIIRTLNEMFPQQANQSVPGTNYQYVDIPQIEFNPIRQGVTGLNEAVVSIKQDVMYISTLNQKQILQINPNSIWLFQKMPTLVAAITQI